MKLNILPNDLWKLYESGFTSDIQEKFELLHDSELSIDTFDFYTSVSALFSSKIEGEEAELDSFVKYKRWGVKYQRDYTQKINDLYDAYLYAQENRLNLENIFIAHAKLTKHILHPSQQGQFRHGNMYVVTKDGRIEYVAVSPDKIVSEMDKLCEDIVLLCNSNLSFTEVFFYASLLHLVFVKIHPFEDGNGRMARLLEKWFLSEKLGKKAWFLQSERNYYEQHDNYYNNIRRLGLEYDELDYTKALPFLQMLIQPLTPNYQPL